MHLGKIEVHAAACVMVVCYATDCVTLNVCFLHRQSSLMAPQGLRLLSSRKSHGNMNKSICLSFAHTCIHYLSLPCFVFTGEGTHSPQSGYVQPSPTTDLPRLSDPSTFPHIPPINPSSILGCHLSQEVQQLLLEPDETCPVLRNKFHLNVGYP